MDFIKSLQDRPNGKLILVSAITPTPAGEGKTTTTVGLTDALNHIGKKAMLCLREPSLGPSFGMKGGAAGGGYAQVVPMEDINLHFTGDFHAITSANNLLAAMIDNHIYWGNALGIDQRRVAWRRVARHERPGAALDRLVARRRRQRLPARGRLRHHRRLRGDGDLLPRRAISTISRSGSANIIVAYTRDRKPVRAGDLKAHGAMTALLKDALAPNLVQTLEGTPAFVHGGPFANIAHGCNSVLATTTALKLADYVVTEAGFGADLGGEKFLDIKCRKAGLSPDCAVLVATIRALKMHGGVKKEDLKTENLEGARSRHGQPRPPRRERAEVRHRAGDLDQPLQRRHRRRDRAGEGALRKKLGVEAVMADHWAEGGEGAADVARAVVKVADSGKSKLKLLYPDEMPLIEKIRTIAKEIYRAKDISADEAGARPARPVRADGLRQSPGLHRQDAVQLLDQRRHQGRADRSHHHGARGAALRRGRVRGGDLRRDHDHARPAARARRRLHRRRRGRQDRRAVLRRSDQALRRFTPTVTLRCPSEARAIARVAQCRLARSGPISGKPEIGGRRPACRRELGAVHPSRLAALASG